MNAAAILADAKLDTGMSAREACARAALWWDGAGRNLLREARGIDPTMKHKSGLLRCEPFDRLTQREQVNVVKTWHYNFVKRPDVLGIRSDAPFLLGRGEVVQ